MNIFRCFKFPALCMAAMMLMLSGCKENTGGTNDTPAYDSTSSSDTQAEGNTGKDRQITLSCNSEYPDYYESEVLKSIESVSLKVSGESVQYIFITDLHLDTSEEIMTAAYRQLNAAVDIANNSDVDFICVGGDLYNGRCAGDNGKQTALSYIRSVSEILAKSEKPVFILHGNHDDNSFSAQIDGNLLYDADYVISKDEWYSVTMQYFAQYASDYQEGYFYYDIPGKNVRVVCLNMSDADDTVVNGQQNEIGMYFYGYKDKQIDWLLNKAMSRENCRYLFMSHDAFDYPEGYSAVSNRDTLRNILSAAYRHKNYDDGKFKKDFSAWTGSAELYNCGHLHIERTYVGDDVGGLPILNTEKAQTRNSTKPWGSFGEKGYTVTSGRIVNTIGEAAFDIVISKPGQLDIVRFGAGDDWTVKY